MTGLPLGGKRTNEAVLDFRCLLKWRIPLNLKDALEVVCLRTPLKTSDVLYCFPCTITVRHRCVLVAQVEQMRTFGREACAEVRVTVRNFVCELF